MKLERIVVGMDHGEASLAAARWVRRDLAPAADLLLVHVTPAAPSDAVHAGPLIAHLRGVAETLRPLGTGHVHDEVRVGEVAAALADAAALWGADLVVVGAHGDPVDVGDALGGTAQRLVGRSPVPVLVTAGPLAAPPHRLLVPVEGSDIASSTLEWARTLEGRFDPRLAIVLVAGGGRAAGPPARATPRWRELAATCPRDHLFVDAVAGDPPAVIVAEAERFHSDLVLLNAGPADEAPGSAPRPSTCADVLRRTPCPVLVTFDRPAPPQFYPASSPNSPAERRS